MPTKCAIINQATAVCDIGIPVRDSRVQCIEHELLDFIEALMVDGNFSFSCSWPEKSVAAFGSA